MNEIVTVILIGVISAALGSAITAGIFLSKEIETTRGYAHSPFSGVNFTALYFSSDIKITVPGNHHNYYIDYPAMLIILDRATRNQLEKSIAHEYLHDLIDKNRTCGSQGCLEHFCGKHYSVTTTK